MKKLKAKRTPGLAQLSLRPANYILFFVGLAIIITGYKFLSIGPADSFSSLTLAPILLFIGYVIVIPVAIFWRTQK
ncbi:hypothetical protein JW935_02735 [candidate division KSB1 bacterium]|nr:hypothetical protein [candidate division KSB1 bacterium]